MEIADTTPLSSPLRPAVLPVVLLVEDSPEDAKLLEEAFRELHLPARFIVASTPNQAFSVLRLLPSSRLPRLILIDLGLPIGTGHEVLRGFMLDVNWRNIPKIMLTASRRETDRFKALSRGAIDYLIKPQSFSEYEVLAKRLANYVVGEDRSQRT